MTTSLRPRAALALTSALSAALLLAGCSSTEEGSASPAPTSGESTSAAPGSSGGSDEDLTPGLLPADAFGAGAVATPLGEDELQQGADLAGDTAGLTITPESCDQAVAGSQPGVEDLDSFAAQSVTSGTTSTVELLSTGGVTGDPIAALAGAASTCPQATISSPSTGTATITFTAVDVPDLGDGSAAVAYTTDVTGPDGTPLSIPALVGIVRDGDRLLTLVSLAPTGTLDQAGFGTLLQQAFEHQSDALD